jgi:hypothetical protein
MGEHRRGSLTVSATAVADDKGDLLINWRSLSPPAGSDSSTFPAFVLCGRFGAARVARDKRTALLEKAKREWKEVTNMLAFRAKPSSAGDGRAARGGSADPQLGPRERPP